MKIAFLSFYSGKVFRGVETFIHEISNRLIDLGHDVTVFQIGEALSGAKYKTVTVPVKIDMNQKGSYVPYLNYYSLKIKTFTSKVLGKLEKDIDIIIPTNGQWQSLLCSLWCKALGKKMFISGHSGPGFDDRLNLWTFPSIFSGMTDHQVNWAKKVNPFVRVEKVPNGVDTKKFHFELGEIKLELEKPIIIIVAALDRWKRIDLAIKAVSKLDKGSLLVVGKGEEKENLERLGNQLLSDKFKILSFDYKDMPRIYRSADLFTYPTVPWESFGIVLLEAMASGLPIVASDDLIRREIVGDAGIFVDPVDTDAYAKSLEKALNTNWGDKPRKQAEKFDWDKIALKYEKLFQSLL